MQHPSSEQGQEKSIGNIIAAANNLNADQIEKILAHQRTTGLKFGEAAVSLGLIKREDVLWALAQQFQYSYSVDGRAALNPELVVANHPFEDSAEFFRDVRSMLLGSVLEPEGSMLRPALAVCSPECGDGKSFFSANLAVAFSQLGPRTLLVDADMRTPRQHEIFGMEAPNTGLSGILAGRSETNVIKPVASLPSLYLLPVGVVPPNPLELVQRETFELLLLELLRKFDFVIVDTPAAVHGADARVIAAKCGAAVALARKGITHAKGMNQLVQALQKRNIRFAGAILNNHR